MLSKDTHPIKSERYVTFGNLFLLMQPSTGTDVAVLGKTCGPLLARCSEDRLSIDGNDVPDTTFLVAIAPLVFCVCVHTLGVPQRNRLLVQGSSCHLKRFYETKIISATLELRI